MATKNKNNNGSKIEIKKRLGGKKVSEVELEIKLPLSRRKRTTTKRTSSKRTTRRMKRK